MNKYIKQKLNKRTKIQPNTQTGSAQHLIVCFTTESSDFDYYQPNFLQNLCQNVCTHFTI